MSHQQNQSQQQVEDGDENRHQLDLFQSLIILNDIPALANLFLTSCDTPENAIKLLELMIIEIDPGHYEEENGHTHPEGIGHQTDDLNGVHSPKEEDGEGEEGGGHDPDENKKKRPLVYDEEDFQNEFVELNQHTKIMRPEGEKLKQSKKLSQSRPSASPSCDEEDENPQTQEEVTPLDHAQQSIPSPSSSSICHHENRNAVNEMMSFTDVIRDIYDDDASNESIIMTLAVLIPNDMGLSAYIIGKQGANVADIRRKTKARTQLEQPKLIPPGVTERNIFFMGTIRSICEAYQHVFARIITKAETLPAGCLDDLKMVIPTELSAMLIGKAGVSIKKIQSESGARTHLQSEDEMIQTGHYYGRVIIISGTLRQRCHAMYLILKNLLSQRDFPDDWRGGLPPLISLGVGMQLAASSLSQGAMQGNRYSFGGNMNGQAPHHPGQFPHGSHMLHSPHSLLHSQFNPNMIPDLTSVNLGGPAVISGMSQKWSSPQLLGGRGAPQISHYPYHTPAPPGNMMYPPFHQGGLMNFPNQSPIVQMQSMNPTQHPHHLHQHSQQQQLHQAPHQMHQMQHHQAPHHHGGPHPRAGRENGRGGGGY